MAQEKRWVFDLSCTASHRRPAKVSEVMILIYKDIIAGAWQKVNFQLISTGAFTVFLSSHPTGCKFVLHYLKSIPQMIIGHYILAICTESWWRQYNCSFYCQLGKPLWCLLLVIFLAANATELKCTVHGKTQTFAPWWKQSLSVYNLCVSTH